MFILRVILLAFVLLTPSCSTLPQSIVLGSSVGAVSGAGIGAAAGQTEHNEIRGGIVGAISGAAFGGLIGYLAHREATLGAKTVRIDQGPAPTLTKPVVRRTWVDDKIEGDQLVRGHYVYKLEKGSAWRDPPDAKENRQQTGTSETQ